MEIDKNQEKEKWKLIKRKINIKIKKNGKKKQEK